MTKSVRVCLYSLSHTFVLVRTKYSSSIAITTSSLFFSGPLIASHTDSFNHTTLSILWWDVFFFFLFFFSSSFVSLCCDDFTQQMYGECVSNADKSDEQHTECKQIVRGVETSLVVLCAFWRMACNRSLNRFSTIAFVLDWACGCLAFICCDENPTYGFASSTAIIASKCNFSFESYVNCHCNRLHCIRIGYISHVLPTEPTSCCFLPNETKKKKKLNDNKLRLIHLRVFDTHLRLTAVRQPIHAHTHTHSHISHWPLHLTLYVSYACNWMIAFRRTSVVRLRLCVIPSACAHTHI